jgi:hypothetical protein
MNPPATSSPPVSVILELLTYYNLESDRYPKSASKTKILNSWLQNYSEQWVRLALIESLYQGRYKMISVEQLLALWGRRGQPTYHFSHEFEALVSHNVPHQMEQAVSFPAAASPRKRVDVHGQTGAQQLDSVPTLPRSVPKASFAEEKSASVNSVPVQPEATSKSKLNPEEAAAVDVQPAVSSQVFDAYRLLPVTLSRLGLEPIQQFMPEGKPAGFCEKLQAIARSHS